MAKQQTGGTSPDKKKTNTQYNFGDVWTGDKKDDPGVKKAQADKALQDSIIAAIAKKSASKVKK